MNNRIFPNFWQALLLIAIFLVAMICFDGIAFSALRYFSLMESAFLQSLVFAVSALLLLPVILFVQKKSDVRIREQFSVPGFVPIVLIMLIALGSEFVLNPVFVNPVEFIRNISNDEISVIRFQFPELNMAVVISCIHGFLLAPVLEEAFFRGLILRQFLKMYSPLVSIIFSSLLFSLAHLELESAVSLFVLALLFGFIYYKTKSLTLTVLLHFFSNLLETFIVPTKHELNNMMLILFFSFIGVGLLLVFFVLRSINRNYGIQMDVEDSSH